MLYSQLLADPHIDEDIKRHLRECTVIDATNVSNYYYQGTEQEIWNIGKDFPNIAPPFEIFFLEFLAPSQIVSRETGVQRWPAHAPKRWGILCASHEIEESLEDFHSVSGRMELRKRAQRHLESLEKSLGALIAHLEQVATDEEFHAWYDRLSDPEQKSILSYLGTERDIDLMEEGRWDELEAKARKSHKGARWQLECASFAQFGDSHLRGQNGPHWKYELYVSPDGSPIVEDNGDVNIFHSALGVFEQFVASSLDLEGHDAGMELMDTFRKAFTPQLHTALLAISFMHCKNVVLKKALSGPAKPLTRGQVKRGCKLPPRVAYHILDIEPMKQILKTEGQSEKVGIQRSLHICRGHFSHYTEDKKLFGKYAGTFWIPQHVRGSQNVGVTLKDYRIKEVKQGVHP